MPSNACKTNRLPVYIKATGPVFFCAGVWNNRSDRYIRIYEELGHYMAIALGLGTYVTPDQAASDRSGIELSVLEAGRSIFTEATSSCPMPSRCPGFIGYADADGVEHSFIYTMYFYLSRGDDIRQYLQDDLASGNDLLQRKYNWVRDNIFRGIEYTGNLEPL